MHCEIEKSRKHVTCEQCSTQKQMVVLVVMVHIGPIFLDSLYNARGNTEFLDTDTYSFCVHFKQPDGKNQ